MIKFDEQISFSARQVVPPRPLPPQPVERLPLRGLHVLVRRRQRRLRVPHGRLPPRLQGLRGGRGREGQDPRSGIQTGHESCEFLFFESINFIF